MPSRLTFNEGNHTYWLADKRTGRRVRAPSVSSLKNTLYQFAGERWYVQQSAEALDDIWQDLTETAPPLRRETLERAANARIAYGRDFGRAVHHYCEQLWTGEPLEVPEEYASYVQAVAEWWNAEGVTLIAAEAMAYADASAGMTAMAGRMDLLLNHPQRGPGLVDLKTWTSRSSGMVRTPEWAFQLAAYSTMDKIVLDGEDKTMPMTNWLAVLHVGPGGLRVYELPRSQWERAVDQVDTARMLKAIAAAKMEEVSA